MTRSVLVKNGDTVLQKKVLVRDKKKLSKRDQRLSIIRDTRHLVGNENSLSFIRII